MILDHQGQHLARIRSGLSVLVYPLQFVAVLPVRLGGAVVDFFIGERTLKESNATLRAERLKLLARLQQFESLEAENERLHGMLGSARRVADHALVADVLEVSLEPFARRIVIARGRNDGITVGQPVIDSHGIMGQITHVSLTSSRATLITDPGHAIPVLVNRSGLRAVAFGTGERDRLKVSYLTASTDIREGDLLVSSGMGGTFPPGYPVARVTQIVNDPDEAFLAIEARPLAQLDHGKQVLLIWPGKKPQPPTAETRPAADAKAAEAKK